MFDLNHRQPEHRLPSLCAKQAWSLFGVSRLKARWARRHTCLSSEYSPKSLVMKNRIRLLPVLLLVAGILISFPAFSFAQSRTVRLNENALAYAQELMAQGRVVVDKRNAWTGHHPMAQEENEFVRAHGFAEYSKWHLGIDETHAEGTKARYKFPFGDFKNIHRCALLAVRSRAHQYGYSDIENAAVQLTKIVSSKKQTQERREVRPLRLGCWASNLTRPTCF